MGQARRALEGWQAPVACRAQEAVLPLILAPREATALEATLAIVLVRKSLERTRRVGLSGAHLGLPARLACSLIHIVHTISHSSRPLLSLSSLYFILQAQMRRQLAALAGQWEGMSSPS